MDEKRTWLIQRLKKPHAKLGRMAALADSFAFGGGGSGLTQEAHDMLARVFSFDYMGAAEFEFGALPKSLQPFVKDRDLLVAFTLNLKPTEIADNWRRRSAKNAPKKSTGTVYVICRAADRDYVCGVVQRCAMGKQELKERANLDRALDPIEEWDRDVCGWYELNNGFFLFTDTEMWRGTCALFGVKENKPAAKAA